MGIQSPRTEQLGLPLFGESYLVAAAMALGADRVGGPLSDAEKRLARPDVADAPTISRNEVDQLKRAIWRGEDPLGSSLLALRSQSERRLVGAVYTPSTIIDPMVSWTLSHDPVRVVDAGCGSGRFVNVLARRSPATPIVAVDIDPLATLLTRAVIAVIGAGQHKVINLDYTRLTLEQLDGRTAFIGNPPYVRHHVLDPSAKAWAQRAASSLGLTISGLSGLHAYFFLSTALIGKPNDVGTFVTSSEWLDVNYGAIIRELLLGRLGGRSIHFLEPTAAAFDQTATTAAVTCFQIGRPAGSIRLRRIKKLRELDDLSSGRPIGRERLQEARRWTPLIRARSVIPSGYVELGELCRVHRGAVTGANSIWVTEAEDTTVPSQVLFAAVTKARELFAAGSTLSNADHLRRVIDLPEDLDELSEQDRKLVEAFLRRARIAGIDTGYVAKNRRAWWSVKLRAPAPILATYMARQTPAFVRNIAQARHINIAHGLYPRIDLPAEALDRLADSLRNNILLSQGRTYSGGLTKFEPKEMERLPVPDLDALLAPPNAC